VPLTRHYLTTPGLAVSFVPTADPDTWLGPVTYTGVAAEVLGLPSSTYRRHLSAGIHAVTDILWEQELHA
jgi:hypothetical protein